jgi:uncharacterized OB-fold protein
MEMPLGERLSDVDKLRSWKDQIPLHYVYTAGVAGERFLRGLQEGKILAAKCGKCRRMYLPPKIYCVNCYVEIKEFVDVGHSAVVGAITKSWVGFDGGRSKEPRTYAYLKFKGVTGGLVHYPSADGVKLGTRVTARFKPRADRKGTILDIEDFVPQVTRQGSATSSNV